MRDPKVCARRSEMLHEPHIAPLTRYADKLGKMGKGKVPCFDPLDGGAEALVLFLFEKPGPMTVRWKGKALRIGVHQPGQ